MRKRGLKSRIWDFNKPAPFIKNQFHYVVLLEVLEHTLDPITMLKNASRCGRTIIISVPNMSFAKDRLYALLGKVPPELQSNKGHCFYMTKKVLTDICDKAGLKIQEWHYYYPLDAHIRKHPQDNIFLLPFSWIMSWWPSLLSTMYVVKCEKK